MFSQSFQEIAWRQVHGARQEASCMFQVWVYTQIANMADVNSDQAEYVESHDSEFQRCGVEEETFRQVIHCNKEGQVQTLLCTTQLLDKWIKKQGGDN